MNPLNQRLQSTFLFQPSDLLANRAGRLSQTQVARLRAAGVSMRLAMIFFVVVMLGSVGIVALGSGQMNIDFGIVDRQSIPVWLVAGAVVLLIIVLGFLFSRGYMASANPRQFNRVSGVAAPGRLKPDAAHFELKIGPSKIRLLTQEQLEAFEPGVEYRLFYIPGPVPTILSAEVVGTEDEAEASLEDRPPIPVEQDVVIQMQRRARPILYVLALLALGIPLAGFAATNLPVVLQWGVWITLFVVAIGFVSWALRRVSG